MGHLDWALAEQQLAGCPDVASLRRRIVAIADALSPRLIGMGVSPGAWRSLDLHVVQRDLTRMSGYCEPGGGRRIVIVRRADDPRRQRFTVAHEMAHLLMSRVRREQIDLSREAEERICDEFAQRLLVPIGDLYTFLPTLGTDIGDLLAVCARYGVSLAVALSVCGDWFADQHKIFFAAAERGHPQRPTEIALRAHKSRCGPYLLPDFVRLETLGLAEVPLRLRDTRHASGYATAVALRVWRPNGTPRSGAAAGPGRWDARLLRNGIVIVGLNTHELSVHWSSPRARTSVAA